MPTKFAIAVVAAVSLFIVLSGGEKSTQRDQATSSVEQGLERVDSVLQQGLSQDTHGKVSAGISDSFSESAEFLGVPDLSQ